MSSQTKTSFIHGCDFRKEKEAAAAKLSKEEADRRRKEEFQQRLKEAKERYQLDGAWQNQPRGFAGYVQQNAPWYRKNRYHPGPGEAQPWHHSQQGKSATWHGQEPPDFQQLASGERAGGGLGSQGGWGNRPWRQGGFPGNPQNRLPWLSSAGSSNGVYGRNNIGYSAPGGRPLSLAAAPHCTPPPGLFSQTFNQFQTARGDKGIPGDGPQNGEGPTSESDSSSKKAFGSNTKLDKTCRWSPYPLTKSLEAVPHKESHLSSSETGPKGPQVQRKDRPAETVASNRQSGPEAKPEQSGTVGEKAKHAKGSRAKLGDLSSSSSSSRSNSSQRDDGHAPAPGSANQMLSKSLVLKDKKMLADFGPGKASRAASQESSFSYQAKQRQQPLEVLKKARQIVLEKKKRSSAADSGNQSETSPRAEDAHGTQHQVRTKADGCGQNARPGGAERPGPSDGTQSLQSFQVSTSTVEGSDASAPPRGGEESSRKEEKDEAPQAAEAGHSSGSDTPRAGEANASAPPKLDLLPGLKLDLTKHIGSKGKAANHEPNLNIARRVRNLSESRRCDPEKDTGLKPTVRQLISSSGSRRNVNWEQVYQEVRKKQDKGKGMPR